MNTNSLIALPVPEVAGKFRKREDDFFEITRKIRRAWDAMGYAGDPIIELMTALQGMYVWVSK